MCVALQRRAFPNVTMCVSLQRRAQKCMNLSTMNRPASRKQKCKVLLQFWAIDTTFLARGFTASNWKFAFRYSFGRSTPRFRREGSPRLNEICVSLQFWAIDNAFLAKGLTTSVSLQFWAIDDAFFAKGLRAHKENLRFATVLHERRRVFSERVDFRLTLPIPPGGIE